MKFTAALLALVAAVAAPLAAAQQCTAAQALIVGNLTVTSTIKKTSVNGGARILQKITVKNNNAASTSVVLESPYNNTAVTLIKGRAKVWGTKAVALTSVADGAPAVSGIITSSTTVGIAIPAGKTLKATIAYKTPRCPTGTSPAAYSFGPLKVFLFAAQDPNGCYAPSGTSASVVTVTKRKRC